MISRDAQLVAFAFFAMGKKSTATFRTPSRLTERALAGLDELEQAGLVKRYVDLRKPESWEYRPTDEMPMPMQAYAWPEKSESFVLLTEAA